MTVEIVIAVIAFGALAFFAAELFTRSWLARRGRPYTWAPWTRTRLILDRETLPTLEPVVEHSINAEGERGDPVPDDREGLFRVLVVGGSAAECWFLDQKSSWPHVMQETLRQPDKLHRLGARNVHVGNIARSLVAARHIDTVLERILPHYEHLDAIVFMVGASDIVHWLEKDTPTVIDDLLPTSTLFAQHPDGPFGWGPRTLALRRIASAWRHRLQNPVQVREKAGRRLGEARRMRARAKEILHDVPDPEPMIEGFEYWFHRLIERAKAKARHVIVVRQPWLEREFTADEQKLLWSFATGRPYSEEVTRYYAHAVGWKLHRLIDRSVARVAERAGVAQIDLMPIVPHDFEHYYDEHHHTPRGCALIGQVVADTILSAVENKGRNTPNFVLDDGEFDSMVRQCFEPVARRCGLSLQSLRIGTHQIEGPAFRIRIRRGTGHIRNFVVTLSESSRTNIESLEGEVGLGVIADFNDYKLPAEDRSSREGWLKSLEESARATSDLLVPFLLGERSDLDEVRRLVQRKSKENLAKRSWN